MVHHWNLLKNVSTSDSRYIHVIIFLAAIMYFLHCMREIDVLELYIPVYWCFLEDENLLLKHVG